MFIITYQDPRDKHPCYLLPLGTLTYNVADAEQFATRRQALARLRKLCDAYYYKVDPRRDNYQVAIMPNVEECVA